MLRVTTVLWTVVTLDGFVPTCEQMSMENDADREKGEREKERERENTPSLSWI